MTDYLAYNKLIRIKKRLDIKIKEIPNYLHDINDKNLAKLTNMMVKCIEIPLLRKEKKK